MWACSCHGMCWKDCGIGADSRSTSKECKGSTSRVLNLAIEGFIQVVWADFNECNHSNEGWISAQKSAVSADAQPKCSSNCICSTHFWQAAGLANRSDIFDQTYVASIHISNPIGFHGVKPSLQDPSVENTSPYPQCQAKISQFIQFIQLGRSFIHDTAYAQNCRQESLWRSMVGFDPL